MKLLYLQLPNCLDLRNLILKKWTSRYRISTMGDNCTDSYNTSTTNQKKKTVVALNKLRALEVW